MFVGELIGLCVIMLFVVTAVVVALSCTYGEDRLAARAETGAREELGACGIDGGKGLGAVVSAGEDEVGGRDDDMSVNYAKPSC